MGGCGDGLLQIASIAFELSQNVAGIGVEERIRPALGRRPDLVEEFARGIAVRVLPVQFGQGSQGREFFFYIVDCASTGE